MCFHPQEAADDFDDVGGDSVTPGATNGAPIRSKKLPAASQDDVTPGGDEQGAGDGVTPGGDEEDTDDEEGAEAVQVKAAEVKAAKSLARKQEKTKDKPKTLPRVSKLVTIRGAGAKSSSSSSSAMSSSSSASPSSSSTSYVTETTGATSTMLVGSTSTKKTDATSTKKTSTLQRTENFEWQTAKLTDEEHEQLGLVVTQLLHVGYTYNGCTYNSVDQESSFQGWSDVFIWLGVITHKVFDDFFNGRDTKDFYLGTHTELKRLEGWLWDAEDVYFVWAGLSCVEVDRRLGELFALLPTLAVADKRVSVFVVSIIC